MSKTLKYNYTPVKYDPLEVISPNLNNNQGSVLRNTNDYHIKENWDIDDKRLMKMIAKRKSEYNLISHSQTNYEPLEVIFNKWPRFKEKLVFLFGLIFFSEFFLLFFLFFIGFFYFKCLVFML